MNQKPEKDKKMKINKMQKIVKKKEMNTCINKNIKKLFKNTAKVYIIARI